MGKCGCYYMYGGGGAEYNPRLGVELWKEAAKQQDPASLCELGNSYRLGKYLPLDRDLSKKYLLAASALGSEPATILLHEFEPDLYPLRDTYYTPQGMCMMGLHFENRDLYKAVEWYTKAAKFKHSRALCSLVHIYAHAAPGASSNEKALHLIMEGVSMGESSLPYTLACCYTNDRWGVGVNMKMAFNWFSMAGLQGHRGALFALAGCYEEGKGVIPNLVEAFKFYNTAAYQGHVGAMHSLFRLYLNGRGCPRNLHKAAFW